MALNFNAYWFRLCFKTPQLRDETNAMRITVASLKSQLLKAYQEGATDGVAMAREFEKAGKKSSPLNDMFPWMT